MFFFFKQKTAYEMRISDWSSDVCSSDLRLARACRVAPADAGGDRWACAAGGVVRGEPAQGLPLARVRRPAPHPALRRWAPAGLTDWRRIKIGRASCRERVCQYV